MTLGGPYLEVFSGTEEVADMMTGQNNIYRPAEARSLTVSGVKLFGAGNLLMLLLALAPILQHYRKVIVNPSLAIITIFSVIGLVGLLSLPRIRVNAALLLLMLYGVYASFIHGISILYLLREMVQLVVYLAVINGLVDMKEFLKFCRLIAIFATILIIAQYFCFYILGFHLQLVAIPLLNPDNSQWFGLIRTGLIAVTGKRISFYRPSSIFLEPSHFAIFCIPVLVTTLFSRTGDEKRERLIALFVSGGILLSTSGMGIGIVTMCWALYLVFFFGQKGKVRTIEWKRLFSNRSVKLAFLFVFVMALFFVFVPFLRKSVIRIFISGSGSKHSAIEGRTLTGINSLKLMKGIRKLIGFGDIYDISDWNMAAFFFVTFRFGWLGTALFYSFYVYSLFKLRREAQMMTVIFLILSFFTVHMFGAYYKMYYTMTILYGYIQCCNEKSESTGELEIKRNTASWGWR